MLGAPGPLAVKRNPAIENGPLFASVSVMTVPATGAVAKPADAGASVVATPCAVAAEILKLPTTMLGCATVRVLNEIGSGK